jgi:GT2 family glycosyltransferase
MTIAGRRVALVVVNYASHELLASNLTRVSSQIAGLEVTVVDNRSTIEELAAVRELCVARGWNLVVSDTNVGFGGGMNLGTDAALKRGAELLLLLNPDAWISAESLRLLVERVVAEPMTVAAPTILRPDGSVWSAGTDLYMDDGSMRATTKRVSGVEAEVFTWFSGACLVMGADLWREIYGFDEGYFLYWEDVDLCYRCAQAGGRLELVGEATAMHDAGGSQRPASPGALSAAYYYYNIRNRLLFAARHLDRDGRRRWLRSSLGAAWAIMLRGGGRRALLRSGSPWRAAIRGTVDGIRLLGAQSTRGGALKMVPIRVLQSFPEPRPTTNPYLVMLRESLDASREVELETFSWRRALTGSYDVFHAHWPEILVNGRTRTRKLLRQLLFATLMLLLRTRGTAIVRTLHNVRLPEGISRRERLLLRWFERWTTLLIRLNAATEIKDRPYETILHGHYRDWFAPYPHSPPVPGRIGYVGLIRRYKAVDTLICAFRKLPSKEISLSVGGRPSTLELANELIDLASADNRVSLRLDFLSDADLVSAVTASEVVVLPYSEMHNSGGVLAVLSLDRPVLVPDNQVNRMLAEEVGPGWVLRFGGRCVTAADLREALQGRTHMPNCSPDLSARTWSMTAQQHTAAYRRAISILTSSRSATPRRAKAGSRYFS